MEAEEVAYRGYVIKQPLTGGDACPCRVQVESANPHLFNRLLGDHVFDDPHGVERAVKKAKRYIDVILG
jgi:hypothetical protein